jgi:hypothetical protein
MKPPMRNAGHHIRLTHIDTSETFRVKGCMRQPTIAGMLA